MANCNITLTIKGDINKTVHSDLELDMELATREGKLSNWYLQTSGKLDKMFQEEDSQEEAIKTLDKIKAAVKAATKRSGSSNSSDDDNTITDDDAGLIAEKERRSSIPRSIGMTKAVTSFGSKHGLSRAIVTGVNQGYEKYFRNQHRDESPETVNELWEAEVAKGRLSTEVGEEVHYILETLFRQIEHPELSLDPSKCKHLKDSAYDETVKELTKFVESIKAKHPKAKFFPEFEVISRHLNNAMQTTIKNALGKDVDSINGRIDLLVIDEDGSAYLYDWKTSAKQVGRWSETLNSILNENGWWHSTKKLAANAQLGGYGAILEQWGLKVKDLIIEPFLAKYDVVNTGKKNKTGHYIYDVTNLQTIKHHKAIDPEKQLSLAHSQLQNLRYVFDITKPVEIGELKAVNDILKVIFPGTDADRVHIEHFKADIDYYKKKSGFVRTLGATDPKRIKEGFTMAFTEYGLPEKKRVYCKNQEDLEQKLANYVERLTKYVDNEMNSFAEDLINVIQTPNVAEQDAAIEKWLETYGDVSKEYLKNTFRKYYRNHWNLVARPDLNKNGIFIFTKANQMEIIVISEKDLHRRVDINGNQNICGAKLKDGQIGTDDINILSSEYGNLMIMKAAAIIANNPSILFGADGKQEFKINTIKAINPWRATEVNTFSNRAIIDNWNLIARKNSEYNIPTIGSEWFFNDVDSFINSAKDLALSESLTILDDLARPKPEEQSHDAKTIREFMRKMEHDYPSDCEKFDKNSRISLIYNQLQQALLATEGIHVFEGPDFGGYFNKGIIPNGLEVGSWQQSNSANARTMGILFGRFRDEYTKQFTGIAEQFNAICNRVFKAWGFNSAIDRPEKFWRQFFVLDEETGLPDAQFRLKSPNDEYFNRPNITKEQKASAVALINFISDTLSDFRGDNMDDERLERSMEDGTYYEIPLMKADLGQTIHDLYTKGGVKGAFDGIYQGIKNKVRPLAEEVVGGGRKQQRSYDNNKSNTNNGTYNPYLGLSRTEREHLLENSRNVWSTDLQAIFLNTAAATAVNKASRTYIPYFLAFKSAMSYMETVGGNKLDEINKAIETFIDAKVLHKNINPESLDFLRDCLGIVKSITSFAAIGFNTRLFTKEMLADMYQTTTRSATGLIPAENGHVSVDSMWEALGIVASEAPVSFSTMNLMAYLNKRYALSGMSYAEMADTNKIKKWGFGQFDGSDAYITSKLPDDYFRLTVAVARMIEDGSFKAYEEDGQSFIYRIHKDKRFNKLFKPDGTIIKPEEAEDLKEWKKQDDRYRGYIEAWSKAGFQIEYGDTLPDAYSPDEKASLRRSASNMFGDFDAEDKSLLAHRLLGSAWMQYKTWLGAKVNQHFKSAGFENQWRTYIEKAENGEELWQIVDPEDPETHGAPRYVPKSEVTDEEIASGKASPVWITEGTYSLGMMQATGQFLADVCTWDLDTFMEHWNNPTLRGQLLNGLMDTLGLMLFLAALKAIFGEDVVNNKSEQDWITQWSYGVLVGFAEDGPINMIFGSVVADMNPPSLIAIQRWAQTANSVLAGNKTIGEGLITSFGATKELTGLFQ